MVRPRRPGPRDVPLLSQKGKERNLGPAGEPETLVSPETPVHVQGHLIYAVEPERVFAGELGQQREPEKGQTHLPAVGVAGALQIKVSGRGDFIRYVRLMGEKDGGALFGEPL